VAKVKINGLRTKARVFAPETFDPGQVVEFVGRRGVVWSLGPEVGRTFDSRWVAVEDGGVELLFVDKSSGEAYRWGERYVPTNAVAFKVAEFSAESFEQFELAA
jgi:hypothetical protein